MRRPTITSLLIAVATLTSSVSAMVGSSVTLRAEHGHSACLATRGAGVINAG
jgi:hypothetical protein